MAGGEAIETVKGGLIPFYLGIGRGTTFSGFLLQPQGYIRQFQKTGSTGVPGVAMIPGPLSVSALQVKPWGDPEV